MIGNTKERETGHLEKQKNPSRFCISSLTYELHHTHTYVSGETPFAKVAKDEQVRIDALIHVVAASYSSFVLKKVLRWGTINDQCRFVVD